VGPGPTTIETGYAGAELERCIGFDLDTDASFFLVYDIRLSTMDERHSICRLGRFAVPPAVCRFRAGTFMVSSSIKSVIPSFLVCRCRYRLFRSFQTVQENYLWTDIVCFGCGCPLSDAFTSGVGCVYSLNFVLFYMADRPFCGDTICRYKSSEEKERADPARLFCFNSFYSAFYPLDAYKTRFSYGGIIYRQHKRPK